MLWERFEASLQCAVSATPDIGRVLRRRHAAAGCAAAALQSGAEAVTVSRQLFMLPTSGIVGPVSAGELAMRSVPMIWCWETGRYEAAADVQQVGAAAREARRAVEKGAADAKAWEAKK